MKIIKNGKILDSQGNLIAKDLLIENGNFGQNRKKQC